LKHKAAILDEDGVGVGNPFWRKHWALLEWQHVFKIFVNLVQL
jgi:hypothetical protein